MFLLANNNLMTKKICISLAMLLCASHAEAPDASGK